MLGELRKGLVLRDQHITCVASYIVYMDILTQHRAHSHVDPSTSFTNNQVEGKEFILWLCIEFSRFLKVSITVQRPLPIFGSWRTLCAVPLVLDCRPIEVISVETLARCMLVKY